MHAFHPADSIDGNDQGDDWNGTSLFGSSDMADSLFPFLDDSGKARFRDVCSDAYAFAVQRRPFREGHG